MMIERFVVGPAQTNCYLITCENLREAIIIDPGFDDEEGEEILTKMRRLDLKLRYIVNTHGHNDHTSGNGMLKKSTGAEILIHSRDARMLTEPWLMLFEMPTPTHQAVRCLACHVGYANLDIDGRRERATIICTRCGFTLKFIISPSAGRILRDDDLIKVGAIELEVIYTPGHSEGSISLYSKDEGIIFTGDTLFAGAIGRTDFPHASSGDIIRSIADKLMKLPEDTIVYPGHGEATTIGREKRGNSSLQI